MAILYKVRGCGRLIWCQMDVFFRKSLIINFLSNFCKKITAIIWVEVLKSLLPLKNPDTTLIHTISGPFQNSSHRKINYSNFQSGYTYYKVVQNICGGGPRTGSCISELQLKVNCRKKFGLVCQLVLAAQPAQIFFYNPLSVSNSNFSYNSLVHDPTPKI